jgi:arsenite-transporting ATPase
LVASLDPAHNLGDVLMTKLNNKPKRVTENLYAIEVDLDYYTKKYLKNLEQSLKSLYRYLTVVNLDKYLEILRYSPGVEEYAVLEAIKDIIARKDFDVIVFDTPPTGLTLRIFALPRTTLMWLEKLIEIRKKILNHRLAIEKVHGKLVFKFGNEEIELPSREEDDAILHELEAYKSEIEQIQQVFTDKRSAVIGVLNPDELSFLEMKRAKMALDKLGIPLKLLIVNKVDGEVNVSKIEKEFNTEVKVVKVREKEVRGIDALKELFEELF